jgi:malic enzyme
VSEERLGQGALLPDASELRNVSSRIAAAVVRHASERKLGRRFADGEVERTVAAASWFPAYVPIVPA